MPLPCFWIARRNTRKSTLLASALISGVVLATVATAAQSKSAIPEKTSVPVYRVAKKCFVRAVHATGYIVPRTAAVVMFNAPDFKISDIRVKPGDTVERGDVVAKALPTTTRQGEGTSAAASVDIHSLASGFVLESTAFVGMPTSAESKPLFTLALDGDMEAMVDVPGTHVFELEAGQVAHVALRDGSVLDGQVRLPPTLIDGATQSGRARIAFPPGLRPMPGRFVRATIEASRSCGLGVPRVALRKSAEGPQIQVVDDGVVLSRAVELGLSGDTDIEVTHGLREGEVVVANAGSALRDGDRIDPIFADAQDGP